jgi:PPOX class probable F420-dependent enzyme
MNHFDVAHRFAQARVAHLATIGPDGLPHLVPCVFALQDDQIVSVIDEKPKRTRSLQRLANIMANPRVAVLVDRYDEDWTKLWWIRADGVGVIREDGPEREAAVRTLAAKYPQYVAEPPTGPAIIVVVDRWTWWTAAPDVDP